MSLLILTVLADLVKAYCLLHSVSEFIFLSFWLRVWSSLRLFVFVDFMSYFWRLFGDEYIQTCDYRLLLWGCCIRHLLGWVKRICLGSNGVLGDYMRFLVYGSKLSYLSRARSRIYLGTHGRIMKAQHRKLSYPPKQQHICPPEPQELDILLFSGKDVHRWPHICWAMILLSTDRLHRTYSLRLRDRPKMNR